MTTRVLTGGPTTGVAALNSASRVTPPPDRPFRQVMTASAGAIVSGAEAAIQHLPGGPILAAAVRPSPVGTVSAGGSNTPEGSSGTAALSASPSGADAPPIEGVLARNADQNLYFLELQERISAENRSYTALSNVLKARHETVKNAIGNIR
jgi:hypothetical protein